LRGAGTCPASECEREIARCELTLIEDGGETLLRAGDGAAFPKTTGNGHHLINKGATTVVTLEAARAIPPTSPPVPTST
jgi:uncharacterized cupin superfamily protein